MRYVLALVILLPLSTIAQEAEEAISEVKKLMKQAKEFECDRFAPEEFRDAEEYFKLAEYEFKRNRFDAAKTNAKSAKVSIVSAIEKAKERRGKYDALKRLFKEAGKDVEKWSESKFREAKRFLEHGERLLKEEKVVDAMREFNLAYRILSETLGAVKRIKPLVESVEAKLEETERSEVWELASSHIESSRRWIEVAKDNIKMGEFEFAEFLLRRAENMLKRAKEVAKFKRKEGKRAERFIKSAKESLERAKEAKFAPHEFSMAKKLLEEAEEYFEKKDFAEAIFLASSSEEYSKSALMISQKLKILVDRAKSSLEMAKSVSEYAPTDFRRAEEFFKDAMNDIREGDWMSARFYTILAHDYARSAEEIGKWIKKKAEMVKKLIDSLKGAEDIHEYSAAKDAYKAAMLKVKQREYTDASFTFLVSEIYAEIAENKFKASLRIRVETSERLNEIKKLAKRARLEEAEKFAPETLRRGEALLRIAEEAFRKGNYDEAETMSVKAEVFLRKAINIAHSKEREEELKKELLEVELKPEQE